MSLRRKAKKQKNRNHGRSLNSKCQKANNFIQRFIGNSFCWGCFSFYRLEKFSSSGAFSRESKYLVRPNLLRSDMCGVRA